MSVGMHVSQTGLSALQLQSHVIANNIANASNKGFYRDQVKMSDLYYQVFRQPGAPNGGDAQLPSGMVVGTGVKVEGDPKIPCTRKISTH